MPQYFESEPSLIAHTIPADIDVAIAYIGTPHEAEHLGNLYHQNPELFNFLRSRLAQLTGNDPEKLEALMVASAITVGAITNSVERQAFAKKIDADQLFDSTSTNSPTEG